MKKYTLRKVKIIGSGVALPSRIVESTEIDLSQGYKVGFTEKKTGVYSRRYVTTESASDLAVIAINESLVSAKLSLNKVDCLIAASGTMEQAIPYNAAKIHAKLKIKLPIPAFDINMTCLSFLKALDIASLMIDADQYRTIVIVSSAVGREAAT